MSYSNEMCVTGVVAGVVVVEKEGGRELRFGVETVSGLPDGRTVLVCIRTYPYDMPMPELEKGMWVDLHGSLRLDAGKDGFIRPYVLAGNPDIITEEKRKVMKNRIQLTGYPSDIHYSKDPDLIIRKTFQISALDRESCEAYRYICAVPKEFSKDIYVDDECDQEVSVFGSLAVLYDEDLEAMPVIIVDRVEDTEFSLALMMLELLQEGSAAGFYGIRDEGKEIFREFGIS